MAGNETTKKIQRLLRVGAHAHDAGHRESEDRAYVLAIELDDGTDAELRGDPALPPFRLRPYLAHARNLHDRGDTLGSLAVLERALERWPRDADLQMLLGNCYDTLNDWERAVSAYRQSLNIEPRPYVCILLAAAFEKLRRNDEALRWLKHSLVVDPNYEESHFNLACVLERKGDIDGAITHFRRAVEIDPAYASAHEKLIALSKRMPN